MSYLAQPYVYLGIHKETKQFYYGYREANKVPAHLDLGINYKTSSDMVKELGFDNFDWTIIGEYETWEVAFDANTINNLLILACQC